MVNDCSCGLDSAVEGGGLVASQQARREDLVYCSFNLEHRGYFGDYLPLLRGQNLEEVLAVGIINSGTEGWLSGLKHRS